MYRNIELTNGMIFSDAVAGGLAQAMGRAEAYTAVEEEVANVVRSGGHLRERLTKRFPAHHSTILQAFELAPAINAAASRCRAALISVRKQLA
jgi:3-carboxy-cis,cis-muconate cycloisomerase